MFEYQRDKITAHVPGRSMLRPMNHVVLLRSEAEGGQPSALPEDLAAL